MEIANGKYFLNDVIASGSFGKVYSCYPYAIKELALPSPPSPSLNRLLQNQISILTSLNHPNIVKLYQIVSTPTHIYLVMEYCQADLRMIRRDAALGERQGWDIMRQIVEGCKEMVRHGIVHRDLKPANILASNGIFKLADFGMAKWLEDDSGDSLLKSHVGTPYYMAPQILQRGQYTRKCDIWSLGVIFYEMVFGRLPWDGKNEQVLLTNILSQPLRYPFHVALQTKELLDRMLAVSEYSRIGWEQLFHLFELQEKRGSMMPSRTYHRALISKMLMIERERVSRTEFKCGWTDLTEEETKYVEGVVERLMREEERYLLREVEGINGQQKKSR